MIKKENKTFAKIMCIEILYVIMKQGFLFILLLTNLFLQFLNNYEVIITTIGQLNKFSFYCYSRNAMRKNIGSFILRNASRTVLIVPRNSSFTYE